jgi:hypothetical protein
MATQACARVPERRPKRQLVVLHANITSTLCPEYRMPNPLTAPIVAFASRLRHPTLFKITVGLFLLSWLWPFDPLPLVDEIATALAVLVLGGWKRGEPPAPGPGDRDVIEGQSRRE